MKFVSVIAINVLCSILILSGVIFFVEIQPLNLTQEVVLSEYLSIYCAQDDRHDPMFSIGAKAAISRVSVKSGIGARALVEYAKCKAMVIGSK